MLKGFKSISMALLLSSIPSGAALAVSNLGVTDVNITQQSSQCSGVVKDANGETVIGASVVVKGTSNGVITDIDGGFTLKNVKTGDVIQISFIGYVTQEITWNGQPINVILQEDSQTLEEVVVVGYGTQKKVNLTGAVAAVDGEVLESRPITNIGQGLQGVVPNLNVTVSGAPGQGSTFNIRGETSINGGSPLVLVDNVQMDPNLVNPEDVASISVLKDAASAAIYGARAAYGVILITTKSGKKNTKPQISFSASGYWSTPAVQMHNVGTIDYLTWRDIAYQNGGGSGSLATPQLWEYAQAYANGTYKYTEFFDESLSANQWQYCGNTDWFDELYRTSFSQQYNVSMNGGSEKTTYYMSLGFADQTGVLKMIDDKYRKFNANISVSSQLTDWLKVSGKIMHTYSIEDHPTGSSNSGITNYGGMLKNDLSPLMPVAHSHTGRLVPTAGAPAINDPELGITTSGGFEYVEENQRYYAGQGGYTNPYSVAQQGGTTQYKTNDLWMTGAVSITPLEGLVINADYTFNFYNRGTQAVGKDFYEMRAVTGTETLYPWTTPSYASYANAEDYYNALNIFAEYSKSFKDVHNFKLMVGYNQEYKHNKSFSAQRSELISTDIPDLDMATGERTVGSSESHWGVQGYFVRLNYNFNERYLFEFNGRYDGSSKFPKGDRFAFFPSFSAAWRISQENFWEPVRDWWDDLKIRASWGSLGNQALSSNFSYLPLYGTSSSGWLLNGATHQVVSPYTTLVSSSFTWETVKQLNLGFDATLLNNRLTASFDWYMRDTEDMLTPADELPSVIGASLGKMNNGSMRTKGWEISLGWNDRLNNGLSYWAKLSLSDNQAEITSYNGNAAGKFSDYYVGKKIGEIWGLTSNGLFQSYEEIENSLPQDKLQAVDYRPGDVKYEDMNGDGELAWDSETLDDPGDKTIIGNSTPRYNFGLTLGGEYKNFDLQIFLQGTLKRDYAVGGAQFWGFTSQWDVPYEASLDYWTEDNTDAYFPAPDWNKWINRETSTRYLQNAAYCRLKNITLGYSLPKSWLSKVGISKLRIYVQGENLFTITKLHDAFDPETLNNLTYPISKKISVGLNLTL